MSGWIKGSQRYSRAAKEVATAERVIAPLKPMLSVGQVEVVHVTPYSYYGPGPKHPRMYGNVVVETYT